MINSFVCIRMTSCENPKIVIKKTFLNCTVQFCFELFNPWTDHFFIHLTNRGSWLSFSMSIGKEDDQTRFDVTGQRHSASLWHCTLNGIETNLQISQFGRSRRQFIDHRFVLFLYGVCGRANWLLRLTGWGRNGRRSSNTGQFGKVQLRIDVLDMDLTREQIELIKRFDFKTRIIKKFKTRICFLMLCLN